MAYLDFEAIKADNVISEVAQRLGVNLTKSGKNWRGKCPVCESSGDRNLSISDEQKIYFCFSAGKGGDVIALVQHIKGIGPKEAAFWLAGGIETPQTKGNMSKEKTTKAEPSEGFKALEYLQHDHEAVSALGFAPEDAERLGIGFAPRGMLKGTVAIPVRLANGKLAGYLGITEAKLPPTWKW